MVCRVQPCAERCKRFENTAQATVFVVSSFWRLAAAPEKKVKPRGRLCKRARSTLKKAVKTLRRPRILRLLGRLDAINMNYDKKDMKIDLENALASGMPCPPGHDRLAKTAHFWHYLQDAQDDVKNVAKRAHVTRFALPPVRSGISMGSKTPFWHNVESL